MTNGINFNDFSDISDDGGFDVKQATKPEDEFFHAVYISGQQRKNNFGEVEQPGKLQIRGVKSNLDEVNMVITNVKAVLVKSTKGANGRESLDCFSYQNGPQPWKGTSGKVCGKNSTERAADPFCSPCRSQLIVSGIYVDEKTGKPFLIDGKPTFVFIRAKGVKYGNVSNYLSDLSRREDLEPIVTPVTEDSKKFERAHVNHKRFITKVTVGKQSSAYGLKDVFELTAGQKLSVDAVKNILNKTKETMPKFKEKFDWSLNKTGGSSDFSGGKQPTSVPTEQQFSNIENESKKENKAPEKNAFNFDDVDF